MTRIDRLNALAETVQAHLGRPAKFYDGRTRNWALHIFFRVLSVDEVAASKKLLTPSGSLTQDEEEAMLLGETLGALARSFEPEDEEPEPMPIPQLPDTRPDVTEFRDWLNLLLTVDPGNAPKISAEASGKKHRSRVRSALDASALMPLLKLLREALDPQATPKERKRSLDRLVAAAGELDLSGGSAMIGGIVDALVSIPSVWNALLELLGRPMALSPEFVSVMRRAYRYLSAIPEVRLALLKHLDKLLPVILQQPALFQLIYGELKSAVASQEEEWLAVRDDVGSEARQAKLAERIAQLNQIRGFFAGLDKDPAARLRLLKLFGDSSDVAGLRATSGGLPALMVYEMMRQLAPASGLGAYAGVDPVPTIRSEGAEDRLRKAVQGVFDAPAYDPSPVSMCFTHSGMNRLQLNPDVLRTFPDVFKDGMAARADRLGDTGESAPENWEGALGLPKVHGVFSGGFQSPNRNEAAWQTIRDDVEMFNARRGTHGQFLRRLIYALTAQFGFEVLHIELGQDPYGLETGPDGQDQIQPILPRIEHFGFRDGISQPFVDMRLGAPAPGGGTQHRNRTWAEIAAGEIYLGHPDDDGQTGIQPANRTLRDAGTYIVFRKLEQDVAGFRNYLAHQRKDPADQERLAAQMVGRWPDGAPLVTSPHNSRNVDHNHEGDLNDFLYLADDPDGRKCPLGAHIRRSNPRDIGGRNDIRRHRILRRGMAYGGAWLKNRPDDGRKRGLLFIAANSRIDLQFEVVQGLWINNGEFQGQAGLDRCPLVGNNDGGDQDRFYESGAIAPVRNVPRFVTTRGGDYFFAPGLAALAEISAGKAAFAPDPEELRFFRDLIGGVETSALLSVSRLGQAALALMSRDKNNLSKVGAVRLKLPPVDHESSSGAGTESVDLSPETGNNLLVVGSHDNVTKVLGTWKNPANGEPYFTVDHYRETGRRMSLGDDILGGTDPHLDTADKREVMFGILDHAWLLYHRQIREKPLAALAAEIAGGYDSAAFCTVFEVVKDLDAGSQAEITGQAVQAFLAAQPAEAATALKAAFDAGGVPAMFVAFDELAANQSEDPQEQKAIARGYVAGFQAATVAAQTDWAQALPETIRRSLNLGADQPDPARVAALWPDEGDTLPGRMRQTIDGALDKAFRRCSSTGRVDLIRDLACESAYRVVSDVFGLPGPTWLTELALSLPFSRAHVSQIPADWLKALHGERPEDPGFISTQIWGLLMFAEIIGNVPRDSDLRALAQQACLEYFGHFEHLLEKARTQRPKSPHDSADCKVLPDFRNLLDAFVHAESDFVPQWTDKHGKTHEVTSDMYYRHVRMICQELTASPTVVVPMGFAGVMEGVLDLGVNLEQLVPLLRAPPLFGSSLDMLKERQNGLKRLIYEVTRIKPNINLLLRNCHQDAELEAPNGDKFTVEAGEWVIAFLRPANFDPKIFDQPRSFSLYPFLDGPERKLDEYLLFGANGELAKTQADTHGGRSCWGRDRMALMLLERCLLYASRMSGLRRAAGPKGETKKILRVPVGLHARFARRSEG